MLREADAVAHEMVERGRSRRAVVEASEVAVAHVVGENEDDVRAGGHEKCLDRIGITKKILVDAVRDGIACHPDEASRTASLVILTKRASRAAGRISDSFAP